MRQLSNAYDLIVVGGGPGGSTLSTLVAQQGYRVLLLEKEHFPRYQIGESLLPATIHGICPLLGVSDKIHRAGFVRKTGGTFHWGKAPEPWTFNFAEFRNTEDGAGYAYQVERAKFDQILLRNAADKGVEVKEESVVTGVFKLNGGAIGGVLVKHPDGGSTTISSRFVADASGGQSEISSAVGRRIHSKLFRNVALFGYFIDGKRLPPPRSGNILCIAFSRGWFWYIPLTSQMTSVGAVVSREHLPNLRGREKESLRGFIAECPELSDYLRNASQASDDFYAPTRLRMDYSYTTDRFWTPGMVLIGDAACFIDPVFSSGVHLATYSALQAARSINTCLRDEMDEGTAFSEFEHRYRREYALFYKFLATFYDQSQALSFYHWNARSLFSSPKEEQEESAFIRLVSGLASPDEPVFSPMQYELGHSATPAALRNSRAAWTIDPKFAQNLLLEGVEMQSLALRHSASAQIPIRERGLLPTDDGLHWH